MDPKKSLEELLSEKRAGVARMLARQERLNRLMADHIENHPESVSLALTRVRRRLKNEDRSIDLTKEWEMILSTWKLPRIVAIFRDQCAYNDQLRACSPFMLPKNTEEK